VFICIVLQDTVTVLQIVIDNLILHFSLSTHTHVIMFNWPSFLELRQVGFGPQQRTLVNKCSRFYDSCPLFRRPAITTVQSLSLTINLSPTNSNPFDFTGQMPFLSFNKLCQRREGSTF